MIRRLTLTEWRAHETLDLQLETGTTFVVAPNGVGKTSIVEAAAWALFGDHVPVPKNPIRAGAVAATARVELQLPDGQPLIVERTVSQAPRRAVELDVRLDGSEIPAASLDNLLRSAYGAEPAFLARIAMPQRADDHVFAEGSGLRDHLCRMFGVDSLSKALTELDARLRESEKRLRVAKEGQQSDSSRLAQLRTGIEIATQELDAAQLAHARARQTLAAAEVHAQTARALAAWQATRDARLAVLRGVAHEAVKLMDQTPRPELVPAAVSETLASLRVELDRVVRALGANDAQLAALEAARDELGTAHDQCPVCRRALDAEIIDAAHVAHERDKGRLTDEATSLRSEESRLRGQIVQFAHLSDRIAAATREGPRPAEMSEQIDVPDLERLRAAEASSMQALIQATAAQATAGNALQEAFENEDAHETLVSLFRGDALLRVARTTLDRTVTTFLNDTIGPIEAELGPRWASLFPGRGRVAVDGEGRLTRPLNGQEISFESFSGGEKIGALLLLRLLVAQMTTKLTFCWFDEPLEHLDPSTRRNVASLLTGAASAYPLQQILLTTYEEALAERLTADAPDRTRLVAIRPAA